MKWHWYNLMTIHSTSCSRHESSLHLGTSVFCKINSKTQNILVQHGIFPLSVFFSDKIFSIIIKLCICIVDVYAYFCLETSCDYFFDYILHKFFFAYATFREGIFNKIQKYSVSQKYNITAWSHILWQNLIWRKKLDTIIMWYGLLKWIFWTKVKHDKYPSEEEVTACPCLPQVKDLEVKLKFLRWNARHLTVHGQQNLLDYKPR